MKRLALLAILTIRVVGIALVAPGFATWLAGHPSPQSLSGRLRLPMVMIHWTGIHPTPTSTPAAAPTPPSVGAIVLSDGPSGLSLISASATVPITVGHVAYVPVEVRGYHRPIEVRFQSLMYSGLVYKLFTRGSEDIIALWSNATDKMTLNLNSGAARFKRIALTRFADAGGTLAITAQTLAAPPAAITVSPLREFYFLSVISDRPGVGWLENLNAAPCP